MAQTMFYERPVALNRNRHSRLRLAIVPDHFRFAAATNAVPVMSTEFAEAARDYPIVFVGEEGGPYNVAALVGLRNGENLMVDEAGQWATGTYVPAFARRYPFVLAKDDGGGDKLTVCIDEVYAGLNDASGDALFDGEGQETAYLKRMLDFLQAFHNEAQRTTAFASRLHEIGLLAPKVIAVERKGQPRQTLRGLWIVDADKLRGIDDERAVEFFRNGYLAWIEAHRISLGALSRLAARLDAHSAASDEAGPLSAAAAAEPPAPEAAEAAKPKAKRAARKKPAVKDAGAAAPKRGRRTVKSDKS